MRSLLLAIAAFATTAHAQWTIQDSHTTAGLRGIHTVGASLSGRRVAWASGTGGTILRTTNAGESWQTCAISPGAETLDFRGIQAFSDTTAMVMSSGPGDLSRVYKTDDGCRTWKLLIANPDREGFWDAIRFNTPESGLLIGDPVNGQFPVFVTSDGGLTWERKTLPAAPKQSLFAASNTSLLLDKQGFHFLTGGGTTALITVDRNFAARSTPLEMAIGEAAGGFSLASGPTGMVAVGGDYKSPDQVQGTAAYDDGKGWRASETMPHGYRSAVAYDAATKSWIAVGTNGTDISTDGGRNWRPLKSTAIETASEIQDAERQWNALSLPFVVGPTGRIGKLRADAIRARIIGAR